MQRLFIPANVVLHRDSYVSGRLLQRYPPSFSNKRGEQNYGDQNGYEHDSNYGFDHGALTPPARAALQ